MSAPSMPDDTVETLCEEADALRNARQPVWTKLNTAKTIGELPSKDVFSESIEATKVLLVRFEEKNELIGHNFKFVGHLEYLRNLVKLDEKRNKNIWNYRVKSFIDGSILFADVEHLLFV